VKTAEKTALKSMKTGFKKQKKNALTERGDKAIKQ
jgi:hypothetical protein